MTTFKLLSSESICSTLGERCKKARLTKNLTQQQLAAMVNASLSSIRRLESSGQGSFELFVKILQALQQVQQLEPLLLQDEPTIADLEKQQSVPQRKRARP